MSSSVDFFDCPKCGGNASRDQDNRTCEVHYSCSGCDWSGEEEVDISNKVIKLPVNNCIITLTKPDGKGRWGGGNIKTDWHSDIMGEEEVGYNGAIDGIEALVLAHAIAGINVESPAYIEGIETAIDGTTNNI